MAWMILFVAGIFEIGLVMGLNFSEGFTRLWPSLVMLVSGGISFFLLSVAMQSIPAGTAYAVWTAIGASGAVLLGIAFLGDPANLLRLLGVVVVLGGVVMLRLAEGEACRYEASRPRACGEEPLPARCFPTPRSFSGLRPLAGCLLSGARRSR